MPQNFMMNKISTKAGSDNTSTRVRQTRSSPTRVWLDHPRFQVIIWGKYK